LKDIKGRVFIKIRHNHRHKYKHKNRTRLIFRRIRFRRVARQLFRVCFFLDKRCQLPKRFIHPLLVVATLNVFEHERNALPRYADQRRKLRWAYQVK